MRKLKTENSNRDSTPKATTLKRVNTSEREKTPKTQILKKLQNSNYDSSKTKMVTNLKN